MQEKRYSERGGASSMKRYTKVMIPVFILVLILFIIPVHAAVGGPLLAGSAERADDGSIRLTNKKAGQAGGIWFSEPLRTGSGFTLYFDYKAVSAGSSSGDGITASFSPAKVSSGRTSFYGTGAYGVELDSYASDRGDPKARHFAIIRDNAARHLKYVSSKLVDDGKWHTVKVTCKNKTLTAYIDNKKLISCKASALPSTVYFGLTASTSHGKNEQLVRNIRVGSKYLDKAADHVRKCRISFDSNGGSKVTATKTVKKGSAWGSLPVSSRSGYIFTGWYTNKSGGSQITSTTKASGSLTVYAHWIKEKLRKSVTGHYTDSAFKEKYSFRAVYDDNYFTKKSTTPQLGLARLSMLASAAAYDPGSSDSTLNNCNELLQKCGFTYRHFPANNTLLSNDRVSFTVGIRKDRIDGYTLVAVIIAGTTSDNEWISNLNLGIGYGHAGFEAAEKNLYRKLSGYLNEQGVTGKVKFWITGHSRGAAVSGLLARRLNSMEQYGRVNVYTYTFASPTVSKEASKAGNENIFNYINPADIVPDLPPASWGYKRYGTDIVLPASAMSSMKAAFKKKTGSEYTCMSAEEKQVLLNALSLLTRSASPLEQLEAFSTAIANAHCQTSYLCWLGAMN